MAVLFIVFITRTTAHLAFLNFKILKINVLILCYIRSILVPESDYIGNLKNDFKEHAQRNRFLSRVWSAVQVPEHKLQNSLYFRRLEDPEPYFNSIQKIRHKLS